MPRRRRSIGRRVDHEGDVSDAVADGTRAAANESKARRMSPSKSLRDKEALDPRPSDAFRKTEIVAEQERRSIEQLVDRREPVDEDNASLLHLSVGPRPQQVVVRRLHVGPARQKAFYPLEVVRRARVQL